MALRASKDTGPAQPGPVEPGPLPGPDAGDRRRDDALDLLFGPVLGSVPGDVRQLALRELGKASTGDRLSWEALTELGRVARACAVMVSSPDPEADGGVRRDALQMRKFDDELQVVWGEVYVPNLSFPDTDDEGMTEAEIRKMAHRFMVDGNQHQVDKMHDRDCETPQAVVVESFVAWEGNGLYIPGSWVAGVWIRNPEVWAAVKRGELNGFSLEGNARRVEKQFEVEMPESVSGRTMEANGHDHAWTVRFSDLGEFLGGQTDEVEDPTDPAKGTHRHAVQRGTVTESGGNRPHAHRYSVTEAVLEVSVGRVPPSPGQLPAP